VVCVLKGGFGAGWREKKAHPRLALKGDQVGLIVHQRHTTAARRSHRLLRPHLIVYIGPPRPPPPPSVLASSMFSHPAQPTTRRQQLLLQNPRHRWRMRDIHASARLPYWPQRRETMANRGGEDSIHTCGHHAEDGAAEGRVARHDNLPPVRPVAAPSVPPTRPSEINNALPLSPALAPNPACIQSPSGARVLYLALEEPYPQHSWGGR